MTPCPEAAAPCPECFRPLTRDRNGWTCHPCCLAWAERPGRRGDLCCDLHGRWCTEASHPDHADGSRCSSPDLSGMTR